ncbi:MAG TPA: ABC transporter permease [Bacteroidetes bacterium]|nr:ABC transporter permease [Bacteroidota bacterium]
MKIFDADNWHEIFSALKKNKVRTFFTAFGVFWGIFMLVLMLGSGNGLKNAAYNGWGDFATNSFFMWTQRTSMPYKGFKRGRSFNFNNQDTKAIRENVPEVKTLAPRIQAGGYRGASNVVRGKETGAFNIYGDYPDFMDIDPVTITKGRFVNQKDITDMRKIAVIGNGVVDALFKEEENPIGEYIKIQGVYFNVVGTFKSKKNGGEADRDANSIFLPFSTMQKTYNYGDAVFWYAITSKKGISASVTEEKVIKLMKQRHKVHPDDNQAIGHFNVEKEFNKMQGLFNGIDGLIWIVGIGTLLAGIIGVSNIMLIIIKERTKEIGVKRALGATPLNIISQVILESVFLTTMAGYFGLVMGVGALGLLDNAMQNSGADNRFFLHPGINFSVGITALVILIIAGIFAGMIPAKRAVSIKPVDALRDE